METQEKTREPTIDVLKGFLVIAMVYAHVIQLLGDETQIANNSISRFANLCCFSGFLFAFGYAGYVAYFQDVHKVPYRRIWWTAARILMAFYISAAAFRFFVNRVEPNVAAIARIGFLFDVPEYSEFLIAFSLVIFLGGLLARPLYHVVSSTKLFFLTMGILTLTTFVPYQLIKVPQLGLLIGTTQYLAFPIVQYLPLFLAGMFFARNKLTYKPILAVASSIVLLLFAWHVMARGIPSRFPPSTSWIIGSMSAVYLCLLGARVLNAVPYVGPALRLIGHNVLFYLLASNILLFAIRSRSLGAKAGALGCFVLTLCLLLCIWFLVSLVRIPKHRSLRQ